MAIYHMHVKVISRAQGRSATAAAAYRAGKKITDERTNEVFDYTRKRGVSYSEIMVPDGAPQWMTDRGKLWNAVEQTEKRKDAQLAREVEVALPVELTSEQKLLLIRSYVKEQFVSKGMVADLSIHDIDGKNPHAHILLTMRDIKGDGFGGKNRSWNDRALLENWREQWSIYVNKSLEHAGHDARIDHRTLEAQGISRPPTQHLGPTATEIEKRGIKSRRREWIEVLEATEILERVSKHNSIQQLDKDAASISNELKLLSSERAYCNVIIIAHQIDTLKAKRDDSMLAIEIAVNEWQAMQRQHKIRAALHNLGVFTDRRFAKLKSDELQARKDVADIDKRILRLEAELEKQRIEAQPFIEEQKRIERERARERERIELQQKIRELRFLEMTASNVREAAVYVFQRTEVERMLMFQKLVDQGWPEERATAEAALHASREFARWTKAHERELAEFAAQVHQTPQRPQPQPQHERPQPQPQHETPQPQPERAQDEVRREVQPTRRPRRDREDPGLGM